MCAGTLAMNERIELVKQAAAEAAGISAHELFSRRLQKLKPYKFTAIYILSKEYSPQEIHLGLGICLDTIRSALRLTEKAIEQKHEPQYSVLEAITGRMNLIQQRMA
jgi:hypothetical protein